MHMVVALAARETEDAPRNPSNSFSPPTAAWSRTVSRHRPPFRLSAPRDFQTSQDRSGAAPEPPWPIGRRPVARPIELAGTSQRLLGWTPPTAAQASVEHDETITPARLPAHSGKKANKTIYNRDNKTTRKTVITATRNTARTTIHTKNCK